MRRALLFAALGVAGASWTGGAWAQPAAEPSRRGPADGHPTAGFHDGLFYLRDEADNFRLYVQGRAQIDGYSYFGRGVSDTTLKSTIFLRRLRPELAGEFLGSWQFLFAGDWGQTGLDNPRGTNEVQAAPPGAQPTASSGRFASAQNPSLRAAPADAFINHRAAPELNVQVGQFNPPFTLEGVLSEKAMPFLERNIGSRTLANPTTKDQGVMVWGDAFGGRLSYALGGFGGDGQNRLNVDNRADVVGRVFSRPLAGRADALANVHVGASFRYGRRDSHYVNYDAPLLSTQGGFVFWSPTYAGSKGIAHVVPSAGQRGGAAELRVPYSIFDLTAEALYVRYDTREAIEGFQATNTERFGTLKGVTYYAQLGAWLFGPRDLVGIPGHNRAPHIDFAKPVVASPPRALQLLVRWEQVRLSYEGAARGGAPDPKGIDGDIRVDVVSIAANYWASRFVRLTAMYGWNHFPDSAPVTASAAGGPVQTSSQRAVAPANVLPRGIDDRARDTAHVLHEVLFRAAVGF